MNSSNQSASQAGACSACGYSLRGIASGHCPECGEPIRWRKLVFIDREQFEAAERALRAAGIAFQSFDTDRGLGNIIGIEVGMMDRKHILIDRTRFDEAMTLFQDHDIHFPLPLVDRHEPQCPNCGGRLDANAEPPCPTCHADFMWFDMEDPSVVDVSRACPTCGYELRGVTSDRCPECSAPVVVTADMLVAAASGEDQAGPTIGITKSKRGTRLFFRAMVGVIIILVIAPFATTLIYPPLFPDVVELVWKMGAACILIGLWTVFRRLTR